MKDNELLKETSLVIFRQFEMDQTVEDFPENASSAYERLKELLIGQLQYLIDRYPERLAQAFYRIDIREEKVNKILAESPIDEAVGQVAELIIERELQKAESRRKYRTVPNKDDELSWD